MENGFHEESLFNAELLHTIDWSAKTTIFRDNVSCLNPGHELLLRPLQITDFDKGYAQLLSQLTSVGELTKEKFEERFYQMKACCNTYYVIVVENLKTCQILASASLIVEQKFIHSGGCRGRIEDVVVDVDNRGLQLGKLLCQVLVLLSKQLGCYKLSLECKDDNIKFYEMFNFKKDSQNFMVQRFKE